MADGVVKEITRKLHELRAVAMSTSYHMGNVPVCAVDAREIVKLLDAVLELFGEQGSLRFVTQEELDARLARLGERSEVPAPDAAEFDARERSHAARKG